MNRIELSNFSWVHGKESRGQGRMLRFNLTWVAGSDTDPRAVCLLGCLCKRAGRSRELMWIPPMSTWRGGKAVQNTVINTKMYEDVLEAIRNTQYADQIGDDGVPDILKEQLPEPNMPQQINIEES